MPSQAEWAYIRSTLTDDEKALLMALCTNTKTGKRHENEERNQWFEQLFYEQLHRLRIRRISHKLFLILAKPLRYADYGSDDCEKFFSEVESDLARFDEID